jgi:HSP20 family protein
MAVGAQRDPLKELLAVQQRMNRLFESALARTDFDAQEGVDVWTPVSDVHTNPHSMLICLELPGLTQEQIDLRLSGDDLIVSGERRMAGGGPGEQYHRVERSYGKFSRRFRLPSAVDRGSIDASYRDGVLRVRLQKKAQGDSEPFRVAIH